MKIAANIRMRNCESMARSDLISVIARFSALHDQDIACEEKECQSRYQQ